jgi:hypothetical protein
MSATHPERLRCFPTGDATFREDVERAALTLAEDLSPQERMAGLVERLRPWYRSVEIVPQDELAQFDHFPNDVWYLFRDGRVRMSNERRDRLYAALASARQTLAASQVAMSDAFEAARAAGFTSRTADEAIGAPTRSRPSGHQSTRWTRSSV